MPKLPDAISPLVQLMSETPLGRSVFSALARVSRVPFSPPLPEAAGLGSRITLGDVLSLVPEGGVTDIYSPLPFGVLKKSVKAVKPSPLLVQRIDEPGVRSKFPGVLKKPQGFYTSPADISSPHASLGGRKSLWEWHPRKVLDVTGEVSVAHSRFGPLRRGPASAGIKTLKQLLPDDVFQDLMRSGKRELVRRFSEEFPNVKWDTYYDAYEMLEGYAGLKARRAGFDAIQDLSPEAREFAEMIALKSSALSPLKGEK